MEVRRPPQYVWWLNILLLLQLPTLLTCQELKIELRSRARTAAETLQHAELPIISHDTVSVNAVSFSPSPPPSPSPNPPPNPPPSLSGNDCNAGNIKGIFYAPHVIGQGYSTGDVYTSVYRSLHRRDLDLIEELGADTIMLRPWDVHKGLSSSLDHSSFIKEVKNRQLNVIATFPLAQWYAKMESKYEDDKEPSVDPTLYSVLADFNESLHDLGPLVVGWTIDLSLNIQDIGKPPDSAGSTDCASFATMRSARPHFKMYYDLVAAVRNSAMSRQMKKCFYLPLDLDTASGEDETSTFVSCLNKDASTGWGMMGLFDAWLVSVTVPLKVFTSADSGASRQVALRNHVKTNFDDKIAWLDGALGMEASDDQALKRLVIAGAGSVQIDPQNRLHLIEDFGANSTLGNEQQQILSLIWNSVSNNPKALGMIVDEWTDDWDRGRHGVFALADASEKDRFCGGRYRHDSISFDVTCLKDLASPSVDSSTRPAPEYFGLTAQYTVGLWHCVGPRFLGEKGFTFRDNHVPSVSRHCAFMQPSLLWLIIGGLLLGLAIALHLSWKWFAPNWPSLMPETQTVNRSLDGVAFQFSMNGRRVDGSLGGQQEAAEDVVSDLIPTPDQHPRSMFQLVAYGAPGSEAEAKKYVSVVLKAHMSSQRHRLEHQIQAEVLFLDSAKDRHKAQLEASTPTSLQQTVPLSFGADRVKKEAMQTIHRRVLEGFKCWTEHREKAIGDHLFDAGRDSYDLFTEALLLRLLESLSEHILFAPERICHILEKVLSARRLEDGKMTYTIDFGELQDGLSSMHKKSNPYNNGLNFDDINECGILGHDQVKKTFKEARNLMVLIDFVLNYRSVIAIKLWCFMLATYLYLASGQGEGDSTSDNGSFLEPTWMRSNLLQTGALMDALAWAVVQLTLFVYRSWQSGFKWERALHIPSFMFSVGGFAFVLVHLNIQEKGELPSKDPRIDQPLCGALYAVLYLLCRFIVFIITHCKPKQFARRTSMLYGTPEAGRRDPAMRPRVRNRICSETIWDDCVAAACWVAILALCVVFEAYMILPITSGLDWQYQCGLDVSFARNSDNQYGGACSSNKLRSDCAACSLSVGALWTLVILSGTCLDFYFFFYIFSSLAGFVMGHRRGLNNLKNPMRIVDLRDDLGRKSEAETMKMIFGEQWREVWLHIVKGLREEDLINDGKADVLVSAAGLPSSLLQRDGREPDAAAGSRFESSLQDSRANASMSEPRSLSPASPIDLVTLPEKAAERLTTFFGSLRGITGAHKSSPEKAKHRFLEKRDALTNCHVGTVPSLSQIIPTYDEVVIPSSISLRRGAVIKDAANQRDGVTGLATEPARGDGINTNLGFIVSQNLEEWSFLAERLKIGSESIAEKANTLFTEFIEDKVNKKIEMEIRMWAALRSQTVAKTIIGALQYSRCLSILPKFKQYDQEQHCYRSAVCKNSFPAQPEEGRAGTHRLLCSNHAEVIVAHQTFAKSDDDDNDKALVHLMQTHASSPLFLVFDYDQSKTKPEIKKKVEDFLIKEYGDEFDHSELLYASCKADWDEASRDDSAGRASRDDLSSPYSCIRILDVLPRRFPLRIGEKGFEIQGKACNQLNALRFSTGHVIQAMDANMGVFVGEAFKMPFAIRRFLPLDIRSEHSRTVVQSRYIGFRERIFTMDDGTVGRCLANAEWTFGTIYQRFLSGLNARMHYGHPDFVDGFWASNRGGMSKGSTVVNLSEDIFAGFNAKMREERCPHIDYLEFLKGREATINAASNFFQKVAGGSVGMMRSRDLQYVTENIGIIHCMSFYFASTAFYVSNLLVDISIYLYVMLFVCFTLATQSIGSLNNLGSTLSLEWVFSLGLLCGLPQLFELILEYGACDAVIKLVPRILDSTIFFMFQNKTLASAVKQGAYTGHARYHFTGRPLANQHHTWRDNYISYCHSHYYPAFSLLILVGWYHMITGINSEGTLPMVLVIGSAVVWLVAPVLFTPFPNIYLMKQDLFGFMDFILAPVRAAEIGHAGEMPDTRQANAAEPPARPTRERDTHEKPWKVRSLEEWAWTREIQILRSMTWQMKLGSALVNSFLAAVLLLVLPANILDFLIVFFFVFIIRWPLIILRLARPTNNLLTFGTFIVWGLVPLLSWRIIGDRGGSGSAEYGICFVVFMACLNVLRLWVLFFGSFWPSMEEPVSRFAYHFFLKCDLDTASAIIILAINVVVTLILIVLECAWLLPRGLHSWWLLNANVAHAAAQKQPFVPNKTRPLPNFSSADVVGRTSQSFSGSFGRGGLLPRLSRQSSARSTH